MMKFLLKMFLLISVLYLISFGVDTLLNFGLVNSVFVIGFLACFFTYGGRASSLGDAAASVATMGQHVPKSKVNQYVSSLSPFFIGSVLTFLSAFGLLFI
ncbi:hypothetical protein [Alkalibacillus salilacus]|uniref:Uncharacterized protein n=1 Tax=Alkalibacillus salilacus TaxID=284582 RepID=A0ABT9VGH0_9BACI|nr:hypothetical protein [Alkalibacillus salilacus]MDQ0159992.1 hypothetical protein [Alkalibacillus salilacus]